MTKQPSVRHKILISLVTLTNGCPVHVNALIIACWKAFPNTFSLDPDTYKYPASHLITAKLSGENGLIDLGWIERTSTNMYKPTPRGLEVAHALSTKPIADAKRVARQKKRSHEQQSVELPSIACVIGAAIDKLMLVPCIQAAMQGRGHSITARDAQEIRKAWIADPDSAYTADEQMLNSLAMAQEQRTLSTAQQKAAFVLRPLVTLISKKYPQR